MKSLMNNKGGYTLLFAVLTATLVLGVSVFILSVSTKQYQLAVAARESMYAFYAADSAIECVVSALGSNINVGVDDSVEDVLPAQFDCFETSLGSIDGFTPNSSEELETEFEFTGNVYQTPGYQIVLPEGACASVTITKGSTVGGRKVVVDALGYNYCDEDGGYIESTRTVERGLRLTVEI